MHIVDKSDFPRFTIYPSIPKQQKPVLLLPSFEQI